MNDESTFTFVCSPYDRFDFLKRLAHFYAIASVGILTRFDNPGVFRNPILLYIVFDIRVIRLWKFLFIAERWNKSTWASFLIFFFIYFPLFYDFVLSLLHLFNFIFQILIVYLKVVKLRIFKTFLRMKCKRENLKWILSNCSVISMHVDEDTFFIGKLFVLL